MKVFVSYSGWKDQKLKFTDDPDETPFDTFIMTEFDASWMPKPRAGVLAVAKTMERLGFHVCVDMGELFYETQVEDEHSSD